MTYDRQLEQRILDCTDRVIELAISASLVDGSAKEGLMKQGSQAAKELAGLLEDFLGDKKDHLPAVAEQLVSQRLPDRRVLGGFGSFESDLAAILSEGIQLHRSENGARNEHRAPATAARIERRWTHQPALGKNSGETRPAQAPHQPRAAVKAVSPDQVMEEALRSLFPDLAIKRGAVFSGTVLQCYVPEAKLAVEEEGWNPPGRRAIFELNCRQQGLTLIRLTRADLGSVQKAADKIRRELSKAGRWIVPGRIPSLRS